MFKPRSLPFDPRANKIASLQSLKFHHGGLCEDYVSALNRDIADTPIQNADLFTIITQSFKQAHGEECEFSQISKLYQICLDFSRILNNASEIYNHDFYFDCIAQPSEPSGELADALAQAFGGMENFKSEFLKRARAFWQRLVLARVRRARRKFRNHHDAKRGHADRARQNSTACLRSLGARLLHRLSKCAQILRGELLAFCGLRLCKRRLFVGEKARA